MRRREEKNEVSNLLLGRRGKEEEKGEGQRRKMGLE